MFDPLSVSPLPSSSSLWPLLPAHDNWPAPCPHTYELVSLISSFHQYPALLQVACYRNVCGCMCVCVRVGEFKHTFQPIQEFLRKVMVTNTPQSLPESSVILSAPLGHKDKGKILRKVKGNSTIWGELHTCEPCLASQIPSCLGGIYSWLHRNFNQQSFLVTDQKV